MIGFNAASRVGEDAMTMTLYKFNNTASSLAVCNDGSPAGFYLRPGSKSAWLVHLQGGFWCWSESTCLTRAKDWGINFVSSIHWANTTSGGGILSSNRSVNPDFYGATAVFVPYCSSDVFSGDREEILQGQTWQFRGRRILKQLFVELMDNFGLAEAKSILFSGCSAGGQAVVVNLDYVADLLHSLISVDLYVRGYADAGWMMNMPSIVPQHDSVEKQLREGKVLWGGHPNVDCLAANMGNEWMCYISPYAAPYIHTPIFIQTNQYDNFQVWWNCCSPPFSKRDNQTVEAIRQAFIVSLQDIIKPPNSVFSAACWDHCLSEDDVNFQKVTIGGQSMQQVLGNWFTGRQGVQRAIADCTGFNCSNGCPRP